jgi:formylglycine-generating enzyme required for sulfatase activity
LIAVASSCECNPDAQPLRVDIAAATADVGFATGSLRGTAKISAFSITKHPITKGEYAQCVSARGCKQVDSDACLTSPSSESLEAENTPLRCVPPSAAASYCSWLGGSLPSLEQWLVAARGASVARLDDRPRDEARRL